MFRYVPFLVVCTALVLCTGCRRGETPRRVDPPGRAVVSQAKPEATQPPPEESLKELAAGNTNFGLDLLRAVDEGSGNIMVAPHSISLALAMTYAGARGTTKQQMADVLHFTLDDPTLHAAFCAVTAELEQRSQAKPGSKRPNAKPPTLETANQAFAQQDLAFLPAYLDVLAANYGTGLRLMDFAGNPDRCREQINKWVAERTAQKIIDLLHAGDINELTCLVLVSAVYFLADWDEPFDPEKTKPGPFHVTADIEVDCDMMHRKGDYYYGKGEGFEAIELPYVGRKLAMLILLPEPGGLDDLIERLDADLLSTMPPGSMPSEVTLTLPKFEMRYRAALKPRLVDMGMKDAFDLGADFSGMTTEGALFIDDVIHQTYVRVDEAGTEAAGATAAVMVKMTATGPAEMIVDRPFLFAIRDSDTRTVLFLGCVRDPSAASAG